jgi:hypothetical protein
MRMKHVLSAAFGALALGLVATTAQAAPLGGLGGAPEATAADTSLVQKAHWWGHRHYYKPYYYGHYYKPYYRPYYYGHYYKPYYKPYYYGRYYKPYYGYYKPHYRWHKPYGYYGHW